MTLKNVQSRMMTSEEFRQAVNVITKDLHFAKIITFTWRGKASIASIYLNMPAGGQYCIQRNLEAEAEEDFEEYTYWDNKDGLFACT